MAPQVGLEPTTLRLTAGCSAIELLRSVLGARPEGAASFVVIYNIIGGGCGDFKVARDSAQLWGGLFLRRRIFTAAHLLGRGLSGWEIFILVGAGIGSF